MSSLAGAKAKVERAKQHIRDLNTEIRAFLDGQPYTISTKNDLQTRKLIYYVADVRSVPLSIAAITGDVIQNLRSALDHLAYELVVVGTGSAGPHTRVYFPIFSSASKYEAGEDAHTKGMRKDAIDAIDAVKPYNGGNDTLWKLHELNRIDKHRLLLTAGSHFQSVDLGAYLSQQFRSMTGRDYPTLSVFVRPADRMFPLKTGDELFIDPPGAEVNKEMKFTFEVAINEPTIVESQPIIETVHQMADLVDNLIPIFEPLCQ